MAYKSFTDGGSTTDTSTTQEVDLGTLQTVDGDGGPVTYVYVYNDDASTDWAVGDVIERVADGGSPTHAAAKGMACDGTRTAADGTLRMDVLGVAQSAIKRSEYGWILCKGIGTVKTASVDVSTSRFLATNGSSSAGTAATATATETTTGKQIGTALTDTSGGTSTAYIDVL